MSKIKFTLLVLVSCVTVLVLIYNTEYSNFSLTNYMGIITNDSLKSGVIWKTTSDDMENKRSSKTLTPCINIDIPEQSILTSETTGRLGNQMFSYAVLYSIAKYNNRSAYMSPSMTNYLSKYFQVSMKFLSPNVYKCIKWTKRQLSRNKEFSKPFIENIKPQYLLYTGFPETYKYFDEYQELILEEFKFLDNITIESKSKITEAIEKFSGNSNTTIVGVHVRRGDYLQYSKAVNVEIPTLEYYIGAMNYFKNKYYEDVIYIVASDDTKWCVKNFSPFMNTTTYGFKIMFLNGKSGNGGLDLAVLSQCSHMIFGVGTFGFWGGYLSGGETIFCSDCYSSKSRSMKVYLDYGNFVLPTWKGYDRNGLPSSVLAKYNSSST